MSQEPEAIPSSLQEEYSKEARERESDAHEEKRLASLKSVVELEVCARDARTKKRYRAARKQLEDAVQNGAMMPSQVHAERRPRQDRGWAGAVA